MKFKIGNKSRFKNIVELTVLHFGSWVKVRSPDGIDTS
jgi:hypothetical protein